MTERLSRQEQRVRNRLKLVAAAEKLFAERGIEGASLDEVAAEAGLTKGAVYSNFASKEELVMEVLWGQQGSEDEVAAARLFASGRPAEELVVDYGTLWAATVRGGLRDHYTRIGLEFITHAMRNPSVREQLAGLLFPPVECTPALVPENSELAKLAPEHVDALLKALNIGVAALSLLDSERCPPELYAVALRLLAGMEVEESAVPPVGRKGREETR